MPPNGAFFARTICESHDVEQAIAAARSHFPRIEEIIDGWKWRLAREPESGYRLPGHNPATYLMRSAGAPELGIPSITFLYRFDEDRVDLLRVRIGS